MKPKSDIHAFGRQLESTLRQLTRSNLSDNDKSLIRRFDRSCFLEGIGKARRIKQIGTLILFARQYLTTDLGVATKEELQQAFIKLDNRDDLSPWTRHTYRVIVRKFYKWLAYGDEHATRSEFPPTVSWLKPKVKKKDQSKIRASDILSEQDIERLTKAAEHPRDKAFIWMLYELGARIGEIGGLRIKDVAQDRYGYQVDLEGKTGHRTPRIVLSNAHLTQWLNSHPRNDEPTAPLWVMVGGRSKTRHMSYASFRALVKRLVERAGIDKRVYPHLFRHTRVTHLLMNRQINEAQAKVYFGWTPDSRMIAEYSHLISADANDAILRMHGIATDRRDEPTLKPQPCPRCETINATDAQFCFRCGSVLNVTTAIRLDQDRSAGDNVMAALVKDADVQKLLLEKMLELGLQNEIVNRVTDRPVAEKRTQQNHL